LVATRCNASARRFGPMLRGRGVASGVLGAAEHPGQCDFDSWVTFPRDHNEAEVGSREVGSQRPGQERALLVSNHFLRGLDHHKLRLNVLEPHRHFFYPDWKERSAESAPLIYSWRPTRRKLLRRSGSRGRSPMP
jgi:hypothetical protein